MASAARVVDSIVVEVVILENGTTLGDAFHPDSGFIDCPDGTQVGWIYDGSGSFSPPPPYTPSLEEAKAGRTREATQYYNELMDAGFTYQNELYQIDTFSQFRLAALGGIASWRPNLFPAGFAWITKNNSQVQMDQNTLMDLAGTVAGYESRCRTRLRDIKDAILAAPDVAAVDAIDVTAGYPSASA